MKAIKTRLLSRHQDLLKIFFNANNLNDVVVGHYEEQDGFIIHLLIQISYPEDGDTADQIAYMSLVHSGFLNMLDDFLLKCGISPYNLHFKSTVAEQDKSSFSI